MDLDRSTILAVCPVQFYFRGRGYLIHECRLDKNGELQWYDKPYDLRTQVKRKRFYDSFEEACLSAEDENSKLLSTLETLNLPHEQKCSLILKVKKRTTAQKRLVREEDLMLREALSIYKSKPFLAEEWQDIEIHGASDSLRSALYKRLTETPYVKIVRISEHRLTLVKGDDNVWRRGLHTQTTAKYSYREMIARPFGFDGMQNWSKTKASIRAALLPKANKLLQLESVKKHLEQEYKKGVKVILSGDYLFWFEEQGNLVGWQVKFASIPDSDKGKNALWVEGKIVSKNHGRIVVLPYVRENGEFVMGYTKNAPNDGKAIERAPGDYLELPFTVLHQDLMFELSGKLNFE